ncbi:hypothetical protein Trco_003866 [Trichoderma cornu-damae]|uniref:Caspase domain-containing protein n=1 Tax=Trichoderma cornu-damae TaxID=654480 RepID=A0A9P8TWK3_9HYPO|nr:hypothetical protein Trco_003866 [Trichoderma cornu-damae]
MQAILKEINDSVKGAFPNSTSKYKAVHALLLSWGDDGLDSDATVEELKKLLSTGYGYNVERWQIPSERADHLLNRRLLDFIDAYETEEQADCLFIIYYIGHGYLDRGRRAMWSSRPCSPGEDGIPTVRWFAHEALFMTAKHDTLFLFDCCASGSAGLGEMTTTGIKETIAACGFETWAPGDSSHSFTTALINALGTMARERPFTAAILHQRILQHLQHVDPSTDHDEPGHVRTDGRPSDGERRKTPVHIMLNQEPSYCHSSIQLVGQHSVAANACKRPEESLAEWNDEQREHTDVIVSIRLAGELNIDEFTQWIRSVPLLALSIKVHSVVHRNPTMVLLGLPVAAWDLLSEETSCRFVGYGQSRNMMLGFEHLLFPEAEFMGRQERQTHSQAVQNTLTRASEEPDATRLREWFYEQYFTRLLESEPESLSNRYAADMRHLHIGHALLEPQPPLAVRVGTLGYLCGGTWHRMEMPPTAQLAFRKTLGQLAAKPQGVGSFSVRICRQDQYTYTLKDGWGALLLPSRRIRYERAEASELLTWAHSNAQKVLAKHPDVKRYGFYFVSGTYITNNFQIITRNGPAGGHVTVRKSEPHDTWEYPRGDKYEGERECKVYAEDAVVFFQGYHFTYKKISSNENASHIVKDPLILVEPRPLYEFLYTPFIWPHDDRRIEDPRMSLGSHFG